MLTRELRGLEEGQPHDARVAAREVLDEHRTVSLHGIAAGLVVRFTGVPVSAGFGETQVTETHLAAAEAMVHFAGRCKRYGGEHFVAAP